MSFSKLTQQSIVDAAIALMHAEGLAQVTLRRLADRLEVRAPSLYRHVADKDALHALMSERIFLGCLQRMPVCDDWKSWLRAFASALWAEQNKSPGVLQLIHMHAQPDEKVRARRDQLIALLNDLGLDRQVAPIALRSVQALVTGWSTLRRERQDATDEAALMRSVEALLNGWEPHAT